MARKIRILIAKPGLDGHDRGAKYIARALKNAGYEVIYSGIRQSSEAISKSSIQEDVDFVGLSLLSGAHNELFPEVVSQIRKEGGDNIIVFAGGVIPKDDIVYLKEKGVEAIFTPGTPIKDVIDFIESNKSRISH